MDFCESRYSELLEYQLFARAVEEQCKVSYIADESNENKPYRTYVMRTKNDGMTSKIVQNPSDPDATYREKNGDHRGYAANVLEASNGKDSVVYEYDYDVNTTSDNELGARTLERLGEQNAEDKVSVTVDGAFAGDAIEETAAKNNIELIHTNLTGKSTSECHADHILNKDRTAVDECAGGQMPVRNWIGKDGALNAAMNPEVCRNCPYYKECHPRENKTTTVLTLTEKQIRRAVEARFRDTEEFAAESRFRNGVETLPSVLRRRYRVDEMPVRGLKRTKFRFGLAIGSLNFMKLLKFMKGGGSAPKMQPCYS